MVEDRSPFELVLRGQQQFLDPYGGRSAVWRQKGAIRRSIALTFGLPNGKRGF
jgi:hypothetical protein